MIVTEYVLTLNAEGLLIKLTETCRFARFPKAISTRNAPKARAHPIPNKTKKLDSSGSEMRPGDDESFGLRHLFGTSVKRFVQ